MKEESVVLILENVTNSVYGVFLIWNGVKVCSKYRWVKTEGKTETANIPTTKYILQSNFFKKRNNVQTSNYNTEKQHTFSVIFTLRDNGTAYLLAKERNVYTKLAIGNIFLKFSIETSTTPFCGLSVAMFSLSSSSKEFPLKLTDSDSKEESFYLKSSFDVDGGHSRMVALGHPIIELTIETSLF